MKFNIPKLLLALIVTYSSYANAWTINSDFESGTVGTKAIGTSGLSGAFKYTVYANDKSNYSTGAQSAKVSIDANTDGWSDWGGSYSFPSNLGEGDEIWFRTYIYFPTDFDYSATGQGLKTLRIHTRSAGGSNEGYHDVLISNAGGGLSISTEIKGGFFANNPRSKWENQGKKTPKGVWHAIEMYVKFSSVAGGGIYRVWQDGELIFEDKVTKTLESSTSVSDGIYIFTYWNGLAPKTQSAHLDDIVVTTDPPGKLDKAGNRFIGLSYKSPKPPILSLN